MGNVDELERVREFYDEHARCNPTYAAVLGEPNEFATAYRQHQELAQFHKVISLGSNSRLIEFGCGGGRWLQAIAPLIHACVGVELSSRCVEICRQRLRGLPNVSIEHASIQNYELKSEFDILYYSGVLLYLTDRELNDCLSKHLRGLTPDGCVLVRDTVALAETHTYEHDAGYRAIYRSYGDWERITHDAGLRLINRVPANDRPLSDRTRSSRVLQILHRVADKIGWQEKFLSAVSHRFGRDNSEDNNDRGYTHDFMLLRRQDSNS